MTPRNKGFAITRGAAAGFELTARCIGALARAGMLHPVGLRHLPAAARDVRTRGPVAAAVMLAARRDPNGVGVIDERGELTFADIDRRSNALARAWSDRGISEGTVIGVLCRDHRGLLDAMFAASKLGCRVLLLNTGFAAPQLAEVCAREAVAVLVFDDEFTAALALVADPVTRFRAWAHGPGLPTLDELITATSGKPVASPSAPGQLVLLTSGTGGTPKGAQRKSASPLAAAQILDRLPLRTKQVVVIAAPLFHGTGLGIFMLNMSMGSTTVLRRRFDARETLAAIDKYGATALFVVPTMLQRIMDLGTHEIGSRRTDSLRIVFSAGSALSPDLGNCVTAAFGDVLYNMYGSTEIAVATLATPQDWRSAPGTAGRAPLGCVVQLYDDSRLRITQPYVTGAIYVGNGMKFDGYTDGSSKVQIDGLMATGDVGHVDDNGLLFIDGRDDDMIVSGGENVYPIEVENLLADHSAIKEAAVIGLPDKEFGQRLAAYIVLQDESALDSDAVRSYVRAKLARHKVPRDVVFVDDLPRNATGKVLRVELRAASAGCDG